MAVGQHENLPVRSCKDELLVLSNMLVSSSFEIPASTPWFALPCRYPAIVCLRGLKVSPSQGRFAVVVNRHH